MNRMRRDFPGILRKASFRDLNLRAGNLVNFDRNMTMTRQAIFSEIALLCLLIFSSTGQIVGQTPEMTVKIKVKERTLVGQPLAYDGSQLALLKRDGRWSTYPVKSEADIKKVSDKFKPYDSEALREKLQREFGGKYQVSKTGNFVVVHPNGNYSVWAMPFEQLFQRFKNYFTSRGFELSEPEFPMVAVVLRTRKEFDKFLRVYHQYDSNILGYYSQRSNRIITYDPSGGRSQKKDWAFNSTLIHEAAHQTAFNVGIHNRFGLESRWVSEGLAMLFEAKGVNNSMFYSKQKDRINKDRLRMMKYYYSKGRASGKLKGMIANDNLFKSDGSMAYSLAWATTFYLTEKYPRQYFKYLKADAARDDFTVLSANQRLKQFKKFFGSDIAGHEANLEKFVKSLDHQ